MLDALSSCRPSPEAESLERPPACAAGLTFDRALALLVGQAAPLGTEPVSLAEAGGRSLAAPVHAAIDAPRYDAAAMDGFAIADADLEAGITRFVVVGASYPAAPYPGAIGRGEAVRIMTGAPMPAGTDHVLMLEHVIAAAGTIRLEGRPGRRHVRPRGSDFAAGQRLLPVGRTLDPRALAVAAAADAGNVIVWRRPRVTFVASGDELAAPGRARATALGIPDSLGDALALAVCEWGGVPVRVVRIADDLGALAGAARAALDGADILVMIGGASRGDRDFAKAALATLDLVFADVAIKPGKPVWYGRAKGRHVLGLPGNPTAAFTIARLFLAPLVAALAGRSPAHVWMPVPLAAPVAATGDRETFLCGTLSLDGVRVIERQSASAQLMLAEADALVRFAPGTPALAAGTPVDTVRL
ncbi:molybdopterin molybdotransferase MoeA [Allosphingosinicella deserti]|uniref:Molybdopterin molybdenumtransferase n=1 Tax=Allosphingosinicella deserti TaxID=2116704 RepID=A0A2P7QK15_9SPHN|nr:molybdopterin molybdotransferase MoeA [Sphingomonas deserti]PSJ38304.1 molybdopterin molybdenumtransferase MoeA [Sphingomonas deserti]